MKKIILNREKFDKVTFGKLDLSAFNLSNRPTIYTLELPWLNNENNISCIPQGLYNCVRFNHPEKGWVWRVLNVPGRSGILIHSGNFACKGVLNSKEFKSDTLGCIMLGLNINKSVPMITDSKKAMALWYSIVGDDNFCIEVKNG